MSIQIIGAGFGRTGTLSLKYGLEMLGYSQCYHMMELMNHPQHKELWIQAHNGCAIDWHSLYEGYQATVDWPSCNLWRTLMQEYPEAKVILSIRDPDKWYDSIMATIYKSSRMSLESDNPKNQQSGQWAMDIIWGRLFAGRMDDRDHVIDVFTRHNEEVIRTVPKDRLLVFEASQGWPPLCGFLEVDLPDKDYPRVNSTEDFHKFFPK